MDNPIFERDCTSNKYKNRTDHFFICLYKNLIHFYSRLTAPKEMMTSSDSNQVRLAITNYLQPQDFSIFI